MKNEVIETNGVTSISDGKARLRVAKYWEEIFKAPLNIKGDTKLLDNVQNILNIYSLDEIRSVFVKAKNMYAKDNWQIKKLVPSYILDPKHFADILGSYTADNHIELNTNGGLPVYTDKIVDMPMSWLKYLALTYCSIPNTISVQDINDIREIRNLVFKYFHRVNDEVRKVNGEWIIEGFGIYK